MRGAKVLSLVVEMFNIRFIDSLNFFPMKLANLPKTFGIEELKSSSLQQERKRELRGPHSASALLQFQRHESKR